MTPDTRGLSSIQKDEHDSNAKAKRVVFASATGRTVGYEDISFTSGDSPAVHAVETDLGRVGVGGYVVCDGDGDIDVEISDDGSSYGSQHTIKKNEVLELNGLTVSKIRITHVADSAYRILVH